MTTNETIGMLMRKHRKEKKMTIQEVADRMGKAKNSVSLLELGKTGIEIETLQKYCDVIGYDWITLIKETDDLSSGE
jgi:transcriptional regulator with XRE-family HTH domain